MIGTLLTTAALGGIAWATVGPRKLVENGFLYVRYPEGPHSFGSCANPQTPKRGYLWTPSKLVAKQLAQGQENTVFLDEFKFEENFKKKSKMLKRMVKNYEKQRHYINPLSLTQGMLFVGKMGSGKTEAYYSLLAQKFYNRAVIHQTKAGDFVEKFFNPKNDILFSPWDQRGALWDVLAESEGTITTFFEVYMNGQIGDKKDYFSATAQRLYNETFQKVRIKYKDYDSPTRWKIFIRELKQLFSDMRNDSQRSKQDVVGTMESMVEGLEQMAWRMQNPKQKRFTIRDFFARKGQCKLILDNLPEHEKALTPLFSAFIAAMSQIHATLPNTKTDFTFYALDEYLSLLKFLDEGSIHRLHTLLRSKGAIMCPGVQYIPMHDKKLKQALTSSAFAWLYFSVIDEDTIKLLKDTVGETEYTYEEENRSKNPNGETSKNFSIQAQKTCLISNDLLNSLGETYTHITYIPTKKLLYIGYTPQVDLPVIAAATKPVDLTPFYELKYHSEGEVESQAELDSLSFGDLFKIRPLSKIEQLKMWKKLENAKKEKGDAGVQEFTKKENLQEVDLELLFKDFLKDQQKIDNFMAMYTFADRIRIQDEYNDCEGDEVRQLEVINKYNLWGALPCFWPAPTEEEVAEI